MILCNREVHKALDDGRLEIDPEPLPRRPTAGQVCPYDTHTVDLRLGSPLKIPGEGSFDINLMKQGLPKLLETHSKHVDLEERGSFPLEPNTFVLGFTFESIGLPIKTRQGKCLAARIEGKSSRARCGILIHFTAPTVHPGWEGQLALEIINLGQSTFVLTYKMFIAQLIVEEVMGKPILNPSGYQKQKSPTGAK